jgi:hypothetical protein
MRSLPVDLRHTQALFGRRPSDVYAFIDSRLGGLLRFEEGKFTRKENDDVQFHLELLTRLDITRESLSDIDYPLALEGIDEVELLELLVGY